MSSIAKRPNGMYRARYRDADGREHARHFKRKADGQAWLNEVVVAVGTGTYVAPDKAKMTVNEWCDQWLAGYQGRPSTLKLARAHLKHIEAGFAGMRLRDVRSSHVKVWTKGLAETLAPGTVYAVYRRFAQVMAAAAADGLIQRSPCTRETSPGQPKQRPFVASGAQVWEIHERFVAHLRPAVLLAAFAGLRAGEVSGLRPQDVDLDNAVILPAVQYGGGPLKSEKAATPIPIPNGLAEYLREAMERFPGDTVVTNGLGGPAAPWLVQREMRRVVPLVEGLPDGFHFHDLRHWYASTLIRAGLDLKVVQNRVRHASAVTTLDVYGHELADSDLLTRGALDPVFTLADSARTVAAVGERDTR